MLTTKVFPLRYRYKFICQIPWIYLNKLIHKYFEKNKLKGKNKLLLKAKT